MPDSANNWLVRSFVGRVIVYFVLCLIAQIATLVLPPREDSAVRLFVAERMSAGDVFGRDIWDNKLPPIYLVGQAANATGHPQIALWLWEAALTAVAATMVDRIVRRAGSAGMGMPAACVMCLAAGLPSVHAGGYMTEIYAMAFAATGVYLAWHALSGASYIQAVLSGMCWCLSVAFRLPLVIVAVPVVLVLSIRLRNTAEPEASRRSASSIGLLAGQLAGGLLGLLLVFADPIARGYLADCLHVAIDWPLNISAVRIPGPMVPTNSARFVDFANDLLMAAWLHVPALIGFVLALRRWRESAAVRRLVVACLVWHVASLATGMTGWASYGHYLYVALAPAAVGIGLLLSELPAPRQRPLAWAHALVALVVTAGMSGTNIVKRRMASDESAMHCVADFIHASSGPRDTVFCWISGRDARLMSMIGRSAGNPHIIAPFYFRMDLRLLNEWSLHMLARPPDWIVEDLEIRRPSIRDTGRYAWESTIPGLAAVQNLVKSNYKEQGRCGRMAILKRVDAFGSR